LAFGIAAFHYIHNNPFLLQNWRSYPNHFNSISVIGLMNSLQRRHAILGNLPVLGYFRYIFEAIASQIQQCLMERQLMANLVPETSVPLPIKESKTLIPHLL
jgi:hypothetical protein